MSLLEGQNSGTMPVPVSKVETLYSYIKVSTGSLCVQAFRKCLDNSVLCIPITPFYTSFKMASDKAFQHSTGGQEDSMCASGIYSHVAERIPCFFCEIISHLIISDTVLKEAVFHLFFF